MTEQEQLEIADRTIHEMICAMPRALPFVSGIMRGRDPEAAIQGGQCFQAIRRVGKENST